MKIDEELHDEECVMEGNKPIFHAARRQNKALSRLIRQRGNLLDTYCTYNCVSGGGMLKKSDALLSFHRLY